MVDILAQIDRVVEDWELIDGARWRPDRTAEIKMPVSIDLTAWNEFARNLTVTMQRVSEQMGRFVNAMYRAFAFDPKRGKLVLADPPKLPTHAAVRTRSHRARAGSRRTKRFARD